MRTIILHGSLAEHLPSEYNGRFTCQFDTAREAISAINANFPGFDSKLNDIHVLVIDGDENGTPLDHKQACGYQLTTDQLHIIPAIDGQGGNNGKAIFGAILIGIAAVASGGALAGLAGTISLGGFSTGITGTTLLLSGASMVLSAFVKPPKAPKEPKPGGVIYTGPLNTQQEGAAIPYAAGNAVFVGGLVIHTDLVVTRET